MDSPDIADIVVTFIQEVWPSCKVRKFALSNYGNDVFAIEINDTVIGITSGLQFATWNSALHRATIVEPHDEKFFTEIKKYAQIKAHLNDPVRLTP